jgi:hypothetical protein
VLTTNGSNLAWHRTPTEGSRHFRAIVEREPALFAVTSRCRSAVAAQLAVKGLSYSGAPTMTEEWHHRCELDRTLTSRIAGTRIGAGFRLFFEAIM